MRILVVDDERTLVKGIKFNLQNEGYEVTYVAPDTNGDLTADMILDAVREDTALVSIGQGLVLLSPLQAARYTAAIANGGKLMETYLLKEVYDENGKLLFRKNPRVAVDWQLPDGALDLVRKGMYQVVNAPQGSGRSAKSKKVTIYGKTGTAEVDTREGRINNTWFTSFVIKNNRRYALTILVEEGRSGGRNCAPLAKEFFERYLQDL